MVVKQSSVICTPEELVEFTTAIFVSIGMSDSDARFMADNIVSSELAGHECHGMRRVPEYISRWREGKANPKTQLIFEKDAGPLVLVNAQASYGHVVMRDVMAIAVSRAKASGVSVVGVRRSEAAGRFADYCEQAARQGVITLVFANDSGGCQEVAPPGGRLPRLSTNPLAIGIPRACSPHLVLDMATSTVAFGRVSDVRDRGEQPPAGWLNADGALRHFGGIKGFGLSIAVEALAGALTGGGTVNAAPEHDDQAILIIAIDVGHMRDLQAFTAEVEAFVSYIKDVPLEAGASPVLMPGERGALSCSTLRKRGIEVRYFVKEKLQKIAAEFGLRLPRSFCE